MQFKLSNAPRVFKHFSCKFIVKYFNDILIYFINVMTHIWECSFLHINVEFLEFTVDIKGLRAIESTIQAIIGWPIRKTVGKVMSFYRLVISYRRFIHNFNTKAAPITECLKKESSNEGKSQRRVLFYSRRSCILLLWWPYQTLTSYLKSSIMLLVRV